MTFSEYYQFYLSKHQHPTNRAWHLVGQVVTWCYFFFIGLFAILGFLSFWWLLLTPFVVYPFAVPGHIWHEGNKPAFFSSNPLYAKAADFKMCVQMLRGQI